ncbi:helix-hairpin-helix domain-containing protein [bacterium]|nr:helix-hairpin-helix domain-containing protein [bacterium]
MPKRVKLILLFLWCGSNVQPSLAGLDDLPVGARSIAMGSTYVAMANTADAVFLNPGGLSQIIGTHMSVFYQKPFGLDELSYGMAAVTFPILSHYFGLGFLHFGNSIYNEQMLAIAYSRHYNRQIYWGLALRLQRVQIEQYGATGVAGLDFGLVLPVHAQVNLGFMAKNVNRPSVGKTSEKLPQTFRLGGSMRLNPKIVMTLEIFKDVRFPEELRFGVELTPIERLALRAGTASNPNRFSAGFGITRGRVSVDYAFFTHNDLGVTHQMSLSLRLGKIRPDSTPKPPIVIRPATELIEETKELVRPKPSQPNRLNINTASLDELTALPGIGRSLARAIVEFRKEHGAFVTLEDLLKVPGIGPKRLEAIRHLITLTDLEQVK